jgi:hypothetical protein
VIASDGESAIDFFGKTALTSLPYSVAGMAMLAGTRGAYGATLVGGVTLRGPSSLGALLIEPATVGGCADSGLGVAVAVGAEGPGASLVESAGSSGRFSESTGDLGSNVEDELGSFEGTLAGCSATVPLSIEFSSGRGAASSFRLSGELPEAALRRLANGEDGKDGLVSLGRASESQDREREEAGIFGRGSSVSTAEVSEEGVSGVLAVGVVEATCPRASDGIDGTATGGPDFRAFRRRFPIGAYPAVSPRIKLTATNNDASAAN